MDNSLEHETIMDISKKKPKVTLTTVVTKHTEEIDNKFKYLLNIVTQLADRIESIDKKINETDRLDIVYNKIHEIEYILKSSN